MEDLGAAAGPKKQRARVRFAADPSDSDGTVQEPLLNPASGEQEDAMEEESEDSEKVVQDAIAVKKRAEGSKTVSGGRTRSDTTGAVLKKQRSREVMATGDGNAGVRPTDNMIQGGNQKRRPRLEGPTPSKKKELQLKKVCYGDGVEAAVMMDVINGRKALFSSGKFSQNRDDAQDMIYKQFLMPIQERLLSHAEYMRSRTEEEVKQKFGPRGISGFRVWCASQKRQENDRVAKYSASGISPPPRSRNEELRYQMFQATDDVRRPHQSERARFKPSQPSLPAATVASAASGGGSSSRKVRSMSGATSGSRAFTATGSVGCGGVRSWATMNADEEEEENPSRWVSRSGKGKANGIRAPTPVGSGGSAAHGGDGSGDELAADGDATPRDDVDTVTAIHEFDPDSLAGSPPDPSKATLLGDLKESAEEKRRSRGRVSRVEGFTAELREARRETADHRREMARQGNERLDVEDRRVTATEMLALSFQSLARSATNSAGAIGPSGEDKESGADAVENLRSLLDMHDDPHVSVAVEGTAFHDAVLDASARTLTKADGAALLDLINRIQAHPTTGVTFSAKEIHPAYRASRKG